MFFEQVMSAMRSGIKIPPNYVVKGIGKRRGHPALVYLIPNSHHPNRPSEKGVNEPEWQQAHDQLMRRGCFSRKWFETAMSECAAGQPCNFTVIGQVLVSFGMADHEKGSGEYIRKG